MEKTPRILGPTNLSTSDSLVFSWLPLEFVFWQIEVFLPAKNQSTQPVYDWKFLKFRPWNFDYTKHVFW